LQPLRIKLPESNGQELEAIELKIDWAGAAETVPVRHVNQIVVQIVEHELNLSFFQFNPPVVVGQNSEEITSQIEGIKLITPDCVARINMSSRTAQGLIKALQRQFDTDGKLEGDDNAE
jgi:hypothetical protein